ncbi:MAG: ester cyclase, partial [Ignavibacteriaceae bacterium]
MKNLYIIIVVLSFLVINSCSRIPDSTAHKKIVEEQWLKLWNNGDLSIADEIFTEDFVSHIPQFDNVNNLASYKAEVAKTGNDIENFHSKIDDIISEGDKAAARFSASGIYNGKIGNVQVKDVNYTNTWIIIFRFKEGKIAEEWWQFDNLGVFQQFGIIPPSNEGLPALMRSEPNDFIWSTPSNVKGKSGEPALNKSIVMLEYSAWNKRNADTLTNVLNKIYSPQFVYHDPSRPHVIDLKSYKTWAVEECLTPFPDLYMSAKDVII